MRATQRLPGVNGRAGWLPARLRRSVRMPDVEGDLRTRAESDGVEFFFAMFVDMHGKPCAKMIPVEALDVLTGGGAGVVHAHALAARTRGAAVRHPRRR